MEVSNRIPFIPGSVGAFEDSLPLLTAPVVRPYIIAILLHRNHVTQEDVLCALTPHAPMCDLKTSGWDPLDGDWCEGTRLEKIVDQALGEMVTEGVIDYNESSKRWELCTDGLAQIVKWATALNSAIPGELVMNLSRSQFAKIPDDVQVGGMVT